MHRSILCLTGFIRGMSGCHIRRMSGRRMGSESLICQGIFCAACVYPVGPGLRFSGALTPRISPCLRGKGAGAIDQGTAGLVGDAGVQGGGEALDPRPKTSGSAGMRRGLGLGWVAGWVRGCLRTPPQPPANVFCQKVTNRLVRGLGMTVASHVTLSATLPADARFPHGAR
jgi:hypothetical protein